MLEKINWKVWAFHVAKKKNYTISLPRSQPRKERMATMHMIFTTSALPHSVSITSAPTIKSSPVRNTHNLYYTHMILHSLHYHVVIWSYRNIKSCESNRERYAYICMYGYTFIYMCVHIYTCVSYIYYTYIHMHHTYIYTCICEFNYLWIHIYIYVFMHVYIYVHMYI